MYVDDVSAMSLINGQEPQTSPGSAYAALSEFYIRQQQELLRFARDHNAPWVIGLADAAAQTAEDFRKLG